MAGYKAVCNTALWVADYFHAFRDLFEVLHQLERKASTAMHKEDDAARTFANAKSEAHLHKRLQQYDTAPRACEPAITLYDPLAVLLHVLREALHVCSPHGRLRTQETVRAELTRLFNMIEALDCAAMTHALKPIRTHIDDLVVPLKQAEAIAAALRAGCHTMLEIFSCWPGTMSI